MTLFHHYLMGIIFLFNFLFDCSLSSSQNVTKKNNFLLKAYHMLIFKVNLKTEKVKMVKFKEETKSS